MSTGSDRLPLKVRIFYVILFIFSLIAAGWLMSFVPIGEQEIDPNISSVENHDNQTVLIRISDPDFDVDVKKSLIDCNSDGNPEESFEFESYEYRCYNQTPGNKITIKFIGPNKNLTKTLIYSGE